MGFLSDVLSPITNLAGGFLSKDANRDTWGLNRDMQREFAQHGIRWKVADAKAAGLHPLAALGASTSSFAPMAVGDTLGPALASAGQDISRAAHAASTAGERGAANAQAVTLGKLAIERGTLENEVLRERLAQMRNQTGPAFPGSVSTHPVRSGDVHMSALTTDSVGRGVVDIQPSEIPSSSPVDSSLVAGTQPSGQSFNFGSQGNWTLLSEAAAERLEDMDLAKYALLASMNWPQIKQMFGNKAAELLPPRPAWVTRMERERGRRMVDTVRDGVRYWYFPN